MQVWGWKISEYLLKLYCCKYITKLNLIYFKFLKNVCGCVFSLSSVGSTTIMLILECVPDVHRWVITPTQYIATWEWQTTGGETWSVVWRMVSCYILVCTYVKHPSSLILWPRCKYIPWWVELQSHSWVSSIWFCILCNCKQTDTPMFTLEWILKS